MFIKFRSSQLIIIMGLLGIIKFLMGCSDSSLFFTYGYNVKNGHVYYKQQFPDPVIDMDKVDVATFKQIKRTVDTIYADNGYFATDKNLVYYKGYPVPGSDGPSFQILNVDFSKDKGQVYYRGTLIKDANPATFAMKESGFSVDKSHVFKREITIDNDASVFELFNEGSLAHTKNGVAVFDHIVPINAGELFKYLAFNYFAIEGQVYFADDKLPDAEVTSFSAITNFYCRTNKHVYYMKKVIEGADALTYKLFSDPYGRDDTHVFIFEKKIEGADVNTFEIINQNFQCARDKNAMYHEDKRITHFTKEDLLNKQHCNNCTDAEVYFADTTLGQN